MNTFSEYMDKVKAEKELKTKTETFVRTAFSSAECQKKTADFGLEFKRKRFAVNKFLAAVSAVAACLILTLCGNAYYHTPVNYLCLDINPSVELGINAFGRVVSAQAYNEDGLQLLGDNNYSNLSVEDAVNTLVLDAAKQDFIVRDGSTVIAVTAESSKNKAAAELQSSGESGVNSALRAGGFSAIVYSDYTDLQLRKQAQDLGLSPGKLRVIFILQTLDPSITIEDYKNAKMTDIITKVNELLTQSGNSWENEKDAEILEKICNAAQQVQAAYANAEREQNRNSSQTQNQGSDEQEQNQNQSQGPHDSGTQNQVQNQGSDTKQQIQSQSSGTLQHQVQDQSSSTGQQQVQDQSSSTGQQQAQDQSSSTGQQQAQAPEEQTQNQLQGGDASVSSSNEGQTTGTQSGDRGPVQDNGGGSQTSSAPIENGTPTSGSGSSSEVQSGNGKGGR
ncbi:MAG: hypothetical protein VB071_15035 [Lawsonibacter sp.]|nr:hypothetical protein [Lawsonibacter sp.]